MSSKEKSSSTFGRKSLPHEIPLWVPAGETFFVTINCAPRGTNQLATPGVAGALLATVIVRMELQQWFPKLLLFMPDHVHGLIVFGDGVVMKKVMQNWKRYTARHLRIEWQRDFFDHRIRNEKSLHEKWDYIINNPVRAGLVDDASKWQYLWSGDDLIGTG